MSIPDAWWDVKVVRSVCDKCHLITKIWYLQIKLKNYTSPPPACQFRTPDTSVGFNHAKHWGRAINPLSAMVAKCHHIIVSFKVLARGRFIGICISWVKCVSESSLGQRVPLWLVDVPFSRHPPIIASQGQLALKGFISGSNSRIS